MDNNFNIIITINPNNNLYITDKDKYECMLDMYHRLQGYHTDGLGTLNNADIQMKLDPNTMFKGKRKNKINKLINNILGKS